MPIYEYACTACGHKTDILHGISDPGPHFCPECGAEGTMRKAFAPPAIVFKGSGWAKKDRSARPAAKSSAGSDGAADRPAGEGAGADATTGEAKPKSAEAGSGAAGASSGD